MATLPTKFQPMYGAQEQTVQNVLRTKFGDGYEQRSANGINSTQRIWPLTYRYSPTEMTELVTFLKSTGGVQSFTWTPPVGATGLFIVKDGQMSRTIANPGYEELSVTFEEVFE